MPRLRTTDGIVSPPHFAVCAQRSACDASRRKLLVRQLQQAQKLLPSAEVAAGLAHDFKNVLTTIRLHSDLIGLSIAADAPPQQNLAYVRDAVTQAEALLQRLGSFTRQRSRRTSLLRLDKEIKDLAPMLRGAAGSNIEVRVDVKSCAPVKVDRIELQQVVLNCVLNAKEAMPSGGTIRIQISNRPLKAARARKYQPAVSAGNYVSLAISDNGPGMRPEVADKVLRPFHRSGKKNGWGLGLAVVYACAVRAGGGVLISSKPAAGTCLQVVFPAAQSAKQSSTERRSK